MNFQSTLLPLIGFACFLGSCAKIYEEPEIQNGPTSAELDIYFKRFVYEGQSRGYDIDPSLNGITGSIKDLGGDGTIGLCYYGGPGTNVIEIDRDFWNSASSDWREMVVFHELGHCYLNRDHDNRESSGVCKSIMASGTTGCQEAYTQQRSYYIDELFDPGAQGQFPL